MLVLSGSPLWAGEQDGGNTAPKTSASDTEETNTGNAGAVTSGAEIIVFGNRPLSIFDGLRAEDELGRNDIDAYGLDTVGQILEQISSEVQPGEDGPIVLVNGQRANGVNDINDLPVEAATKIQILPREAAGRLGQSPSRRVINVVIKPDHVQITPSAQTTLSTRGDAFRGEAEINLLKLQNSNRRSLVLRASHIDPLFESERGILPDIGNVPFGRVGNVVSSPLVGGEIDPLLSALAGRPLTATAVPSGVAMPTLANFATGANVPNPAGTGAFRSLIANTESYSANGNLSQRLSSKTTLLFNAKLERNESLSLRGLTPALLRLPATSPFSPFSREVALAYQLGDPLRTRQNFSNADLALGINSQVGKFGLSARSGFTRRVMNVTSDRNYDLTAVQAGIAAGTLNPFMGFATSSLGNVRRDHSRSRSDSSSMQVSANGPLFDLPAGAAQISATARARFDRLSSRLEGLTRNARQLSRDELGVQGNLSLPLVRSSGKAPVNLTADLNGHLHKLNRSGTLRDWGMTFSGDLGRPFSLSASYLREEIAAPNSALNEPVFVIENFRAFDFIRQETVLVRNIAGGDLSLPVQRKRTTTLQANLRPFAGYDFIASAEYLRIANRNVFAALPPVSAEVQAAFPDRFVRDATGTLIQIDARPVTFLRDKTEKMRWGVKFRRTFGGVAIGEEDAGGPAATKGRGVRVNFDLTHDWTLDATRQARASLPVIDLLRGGAIGYGGGLIRHAIAVNAGLASRGLGLQLNGQYRGPSFLTAGTPTAPSRLDFQSRTLVNLRLFANLGPILPKSSWARGLRLSIQANNLFDSKQRVTDQTGATPLRYQPFLTDPIGRSITVGLRKAF